MASAPDRTFRDRLRAREPLLGTFIKTPSPHAVEIVGDVGLDFVVIDQEHGPFDRGSVDLLLLAARASGIAGLVRVGSAEHILPALDGGAAGVVVPHVSTVESARGMAAACRYRDGTRGYSGATRAGRYGGLSRWDHVEQSDAGVAVIAQIEDPQALACIDDIAAVDGIDALFIGRGDLTVALGLSSSEGPEMVGIVASIAAAGQSAGKAICGYAAGRAEAEFLAQHGASAFVVSSDQGFVRREAQRTLKDFQTLSGSWNRPHAG